MTVPNALRCEELLCRKTIHLFINFDMHYHVFPFDVYVNLQGWCSGIRSILRKVRLKTIERRGNFKYKSKDRKF